MSIEHHFYMDTSASRHELRDALVRAGIGLEAKPDFEHLSHASSVATGVTLLDDLNTWLPVLLRRGGRLVLSQSCHKRGEYARDEDGNGFREIHVNTMEGLWSLLRSWLRPHRGVSQEKLPLCLGVSQFVHNARRRGKALPGALIAGLIA